MSRSPRRTRVVLLAFLSLLLAALTTTGLAAPAGASRTKGRPVHPRPTMSSAQARTALTRARLLLHGTPQQARRVQRVEDATMVLRDLRIAYPRLSLADRRQADHLLARPGPTADGSGDPVYSGPEHQLCNNDICVHYDLSTDDAVNGVAPTDADGDGKPDYVQLALDTVTHVRSTYAAAGYRLPLSDASSTDDGGDGRTDIYLAELGDQQLYGYCTSDDPNVSSQSSIYYASAYCVLDNDFSHAEFPTHTPEQNLDVTAAHEFFHAVQFSYDFFEDSWIMEATATWAEDQLYTDINDNVQYLADSPLSKPGVPLDIDGMHWYGTWIFFRFLTERVVRTAGAGGLPVLVRQIWARLDSNTSAAPAAPDQYSMQAVRTALAAHGTTLTSAFSRFVLAARHPRSFFREAAANHYPTAPLGSSTTLSPGRPTVKAAVSRKHMTYDVLRVSPKKGMGRAWHLRLSLDLPDTSQGSAAALWIDNRSGGHSSRLVKLSSKGVAHLDLGFGYTRVRDVEISIINASTRYSCWPPYDARYQGHYYSCGAHSGLDDGTRNHITATAYRR